MSAPIVTEQTTGALNGQNGLVPTWPFPIVLASASPRRVELLSRIAPEFEIDPAHLDEDALTAEDPWQTAENLALAKALAVQPRHPRAVVIGGDTVVACEERPGRYFQLAKPDSPAGAERMLRLLSGCSHLVITGVGLVSPWGREAFCETSTVWFRPITESEIAEYVRSGEPMDKAGAYAIQGGAACWVDRVEGSVDNVIGLPVDELELRLERLAGFLASRSADRD